MTDEVELKGILSYLSIQKQIIPEAKESFRHFSFSLTIDRRQNRFSRIVFPSGDFKVCKAEREEEGALSPHVDLYERYFGI